MAFRNGETRRGGNLDRVSECVLGQNDNSVDTVLSRVLQAKLARRLGIGIEVAGVVAHLAGLGPREARR